VNIQAVLDAWVAYLPSVPYTTPAGSTLSTYYDWAPPLPYSGDYPFVVVKPGSQSSVLIAGHEEQTTGLYHLVFFDELGGDQSSIGGVIKHAALFANALERALRSGPLSAGWTLNGQVASASDNYNGGPGVTADFDGVIEIRDVEDRPLYGITIDVAVVEKPQPA